MRARKWAIGLTLAGVIGTLVGTALALTSVTPAPPELGEHWRVMLVVGVLWVALLAWISLRMVDGAPKPAAISLVITAIFGGLVTAPFFLAAAVCSWRSSGASRPSPASPAARAAAPPAR